MGGPDGESRTMLLPAPPLMADIRSREMMRGVGGVADGVGDHEAATLRCCCGREGCVFLRHNCAVLDHVEKDVLVAARMGQTLLQRHEAYMESAERDRLELTARIEQLEMEKAELESENRRTIEENRALLDQLEQLNSTVRDSDAQVQALEATLRDSQREVRRLEQATERATAMERHIAVLEEEQAALQQTLVTTKEDARTTMHRWRDAERGLNEMQRELERMEKEAREERERHVEVLGRMERQRAVEKDLNTAAGRLKGAAAAKSLNDCKKGGSSVVNHFVRDLMLDNANLQNNIAELRDTLMNAQNEIEVLREQLLYHQPLIAPGTPGRGDGETSATSTLRAELESTEPASPRVSQELHIHHHYHVTAKAEPKKPKKKRLGLSPAIFTPPQMSSSPSVGPWQLGHSSPDVALVSHASRASTSTISAPSEPRWSTISENPSDFAPSSVPSSPLSNPRHSMFDRSIMDVSSPASPTTSLDPLSPTWRMSHRKRGSEMSARSFAMPHSMSPSPSPQNRYHHRAASITQPHPLANTIHEGDLASPEPYTTDDLPDPPTSTDDSTIETTSSEDDATDDETGPTLRSPAIAQTHFDPTVEHRPRRTLRHAVSHESIMSLSNGMDIHTLKARPSQLTLRPLGMTAAGTGITAVNVRADHLSRASADGRRGSLILRDNLSSAVGLGLPMPRMREGSRIVSETTSGIRHQPSINTFTRLVSWRPWANQGPVAAAPQIEVSTTTVEAHSSPSTTPTLSSSTASTVTPTLSFTTLAANNTAAVTANSSININIAPQQDHQHLLVQSPTLSQLSTSSGSSTGGGSGAGGGGGARHHLMGFVKGDASRASGINQPGAIPGFHEYFAKHQRTRPPAKVLPDHVDTEALREVLEE